MIKNRRRRKRKEEREKLTVILVALLFIGAIVVAILSSTGFFGMLETIKPDIIDGRGPTVYTHTFSVTAGDSFIIAQKIRIPYNVVRIHLVDITGVSVGGTGAISSTTLGISIQKSDDPNDWLFDYDKSPADIIGGHYQIKTTVVHPYLGIEVVPGNYYYYMAKIEFRYPRTVTIQATNTYADGGIHICDNGQWSTRSGNIKFTTQGYLTYGVDVEILSAGAYPSTITEGQTATFQGVLVSTSGGTCEVFLMGKIGTAYFVDLGPSEVLNFAQGEQKTVVLTKSGLPQGTHHMMLEVRVGGEEEAHRCFTLTVTGVNSPPSVPTLTGSSSLGVGATGSWSARSTDLEGSTIKYSWKADGTLVRVSGYIPSGSSDILSYSFSSAGSYTIAVQAEDIGGATSSWASKTVQVSQGTPGQYTATIYVKDSVTSAGIGGASVTVGSQQGTTSQYGMVEFQLAAGTYTVSASATGYSPNTGSITVTTSGGSGTVYLTPSEAQEHTLSVYISDNTTYLAVENAYVTCNDVLKITDSNGLVQYSLSAGEYSVVVSKANYETQIKSAAISNADVPLSIFLNPTGEGNGENGVPGFGLLAFIAALGIAGILMKRRRRKK